MKTKTSTRLIYAASTWVGTSLLLAGFLGCGSDPGKLLNGSMDTQFMRSSLNTLAPTQIGSGIIWMVNGVYGASCSHQGADGKWTVPTNGYAGALDHEALQVVSGNALCTLQITDVEIKLDAPFPWQYRTQTPMAITSSYLNQSVAFEDPTNPGPILFYANVIQDAGTSSFTAPIHATFAYSSDVNLIPGTFHTTFGLQTASVTTNKILPSTYALNLAASTLSIIVDSSNVMQTITGSLQFDSGVILGNDYVVVSSLSSINDYGVVDAAFKAQNLLTPATVLPGVGGFTINGATQLNFITGTTVVPVHRYIIIRHYDSAEPPPPVGQPVSSYQVFDITFDIPL